MLVFLIEDLQLVGENPTLPLRHGKGSRDRVLPVHPELAAAFRQLIDFGKVHGRWATTTRSTAWRWTKEALRRAQELATIQRDGGPGRTPCGIAPLGIGWLQVCQSIT